MQGSSPLWYSYHLGGNARRLCLCPQLHSTPRVWKLIKKLWGTIPLTQWRTIVTWWCGRYSVELHYCFSAACFSLFCFFKIHTSLSENWDHTGSFSSTPASSPLQREIWEECALNFKVGGLIVFFFFFLLRPLFSPREESDGLSFRRGCRTTAGGLPLRALSTEWNCPWKSSLLPVGFFLLPPLSFHHDRIAFSFFIICYVSFLLLTSR